MYRLQWYIFWIIKSNCFPLKRHIVIEIFTQVPYFMNIPLKTSVAAFVSKWQISLSKMLIFMFMRQFKTLTASTRQSVKNEWLTATACGEAHHCMAMMLKSKVFGGFFDDGMYMYENDMPHIMEFHLWSYSSPAWSCCCLSLSLRAITDRCD